MNNIDAARNWVAAGALRHDGSVGCFSPPVRSRSAASFSSSHAIHCSSVQSSGSSGGGATAPRLPARPVPPDSGCAQTRKSSAFVYISDIGLADADEEGEEEGE